jgi:aspartyl-tRNA synthetase
MRNSDIPTGDIEVLASSVELIGPAETPAIPVARGKGEKLAAEELRLRHRHLDLRRPELQENLVLRHRLMQTTRKYLDEQRLSRNRNTDSHQADSRGSARLSRAEQECTAGSFYALPQSPQLYKQLLMVSGIRPVLPDRCVAFATRI